MIRSTFIIAVFLGYFAQCQEIPNGGFENWEQKSYGEEPTNWGEYSLQFLHSVFPGIFEQIIGMEKLIASITAKDIPSDRLRFM